VQAGRKTGGEVVSDRYRLSAELRQGASTPAEIYLDEGRLQDATAARAGAGKRRSRVSWRLADIAQAAGDADEATLHFAAARSGFEDLLAKIRWRSPITAEFYMGSGDDPARALRWRS
jgi:hypothetical protein